MLGEKDWAIQIGVSPGLETMWRLAIGPKLTPNGQIHFDFLVKKKTELVLLDSKLYCSSYDNIIGLYQIWHSTNYSHYLLREAV